VCCCVHGYRSAAPTTAVCFHRDSHLIMWQNCDWALSGALVGAQGWRGTRCGERDRGRGCCW
jgi:hypothetical protein